MDGLMGPGKGQGGQGQAMGKGNNAKTSTLKKSKTVKSTTTSGTVSSVDGDTVTITGKDGSTYKIDGSKTKPTRRLGGAMDNADIQVGDSLTVSGTVADDGTVTPTSVRDTSVEAKSLSYSGTVTALGDSSFTFQTKARGTLTVSYDSSTSILLNGKADTIADLAVGQTVTMTGTLNTTSKTIAATKVNMIIKTLAITVSGTVQSVSGSTLTVLDKSNVTYTIDASKARVQYKNGKKAADLTIVQTSDSVTVTGKHQSGSNNVTASVVRDLTQVYKAS
jgi:hypothetical protein